MKSPSEETPEIHERALTLTLKALGERGDVEVAFTDLIRTPPTEKRVLVPRPVATETLAAQDSVRGAADAAALRLRYHDGRLARRAAPATAGSNERALVAALEDARCEALGARHFRGTARNVGAWLESRFQVHSAALNATGGLTLGAGRESDPPLATLAHLLAYNAFADRSPSLPSLARDLAPWNAMILERDAEAFDRLRRVLGDQAAFTVEARRLARLIAGLEPGATPGTPPPAATPDQPPEPPPPPSDAPESQAPLPATEGASAEDTPTGGEDSAATPGEEPGISQGDGQSPDDEDGKARLGQRARAGRGANTSPAGQRLALYKPFTTAFDEIARAEDLCAGDDLARLRELLDQRARGMHGVVARLANRLQRQLMAQQTRGWDDDQEEGILDTGRLTRVITSPEDPLAFKVERESPFRDTVVTLLLDNSGSMRGRPILLTALSADILARTLERCGVKTEILGFTTRSWKGGRAREEWLQAGRPASPGRLNETRHILYKTADTPWRRARRNLGLLLREGLLKENIDGEALLWAHGRLVARPEQRRILMVISDGAPVDDSTLAVNPGAFLEDHLRAVIAWIEDTSSVELVALGIGHDVTRFYRRAVTLTDPESLGSAMIAQLAALFDPAQDRFARRNP